AGAKPIIIATSSKSHGGKDTLVAFMCGNTAKTSISFEVADWALQKAFITAVKYDPRVGVVNVENVRVDGRSRVIASSFLERFTTDAQPLLYSTGTGAAIQKPNHWVVTETTNFGTVSEDAMNRALSIHLIPKGDVSHRRSPIGNPKLEYLP